MSKHPVLWFAIGIALGYFVVPYAIGLVVGRK